MHIYDRYVIYINSMIEILIIAMQVTEALNIVRFRVEDDKSIMLELKATEEEFIQLKGHVSNLCVFSDFCISDHARVIKSGSRHNTSKYFLLPASIRRNFKGYDYDNVKCGYIVSENQCVYFIYSAKKK